MFSRKASVHVISAQDGLVGRIPRNTGNAQMMHVAGNTSQAVADIPYRARPGNLAE